MGILVSEGQSDRDVAREASGTIPGSDLGKWALLARLVWFAQGIRYAGQEIQAPAKGTDARVERWLGWSTTLPFTPDHFTARQCFSFGTGEEILTSVLPCTIQDAYRTVGGVRLID